MKERSIVIVANVASADSGLRLGARVVVLGVPGNPDHLEVRGLSRSGRRITKWVPRTRLKNYRPAWDEKTEEAWLRFESKAAASAYIQGRLATPSGGEPGGSTP